MTYKLEDAADLHGASLMSADLKRTKVEDDILSFIREIEEWELKRKAELLPKTVIRAQLFITALCCAGFIMGVPLEYAISFFVSGLLTSWAVSFYQEKQISRRRQELEQIKRKHQ